MNYPYTLKIKVKNVFGEEDVKITLFSGLTTFVGTNASGKTQTLKALRDKFKRDLGVNKVRYLSSNRIGTMEEYRSKSNQYTHSVDDYTLGDHNVKKVRQQIETATGDFFAMDERKDVYIKVAERLSVLFNRQIYIRWASGKMKVTFGKTDSEDEYSVAAEASGLINVISILAALFDEAVSVLLIDEPEVSLHPQLQSYLLREIKNAVVKYDKTVIISTHSAEMIELRSSDELCNFAFFAEKKHPIQVEPDAPELKSKQLKDFLLRIGLVYNEGFFAKKILLIEGVSDMILCRFLCNKLALNIDVAGTQIIPVDGKGQFPIITKFFRLIGKEVCVLTDLDGFTDDNTVINLFSELPEAKKIANKQGNNDLQGLIRDLKDKIEKMVESDKENLKKIYESHPYWINRDPETEENKIIRRAIVAQLFNTDNDELEGWFNSNEWESVKIRITALLDILEKLGCFILRKGAIESYYMFSPNETYNGKPSAAVNEISELQELTNNQIKEQYSDVIRALKYASLNKKVDESFAVKKELLSELALVLGVLDKVKNDKELLSIVKQTKGNTESLFDYKIIEVNKKRGVEVSLCSKIIDVQGLPFKAFVNDNVNQIVDANILPVNN